MPGQKVRHQRRQQVLAEGLGHRQAHLAAGIAHQSLAHRHGSLVGAEHLPAALEHLAAALGQAQAAGGAFQQALALTAVQSGVIGFGCLLLGALPLPEGLPPLPTAPAFWVGSLYLVLFAALFAVMWLCEQLSVQAWAGGLLIVAATLWTSLSRR